MKYFSLKLFLHLKKYIGDFAIRELLSVTILLKITCRFHYICYRYFRGPLFTATYIIDTYFLIAQRRWLSGLECLARKQKMGVRVQAATDLSH